MLRNSGDTMTKETKLPFHIDLLKPGAIVHCRNGGASTIDFCEPSKTFKGGLYVRLDGYKRGINIGRNGGIVDDMDSPFDIIAVTPAPEAKRLSGVINITPKGIMLNANFHDLNRIACIDLSEIYDKNGKPICEGHGL